MGTFNTSQAVAGSDDIAELARQYLDEPGSRGLERIDEHISLAKADARWDDMSKWHRVRFRLLRLQNERAIGAQLERPCESRSAAK